MGFYIFETYFAKWDGLIWIKPGTRVAIGATLGNMFALTKNKEGVLSAFPDLFPGAQFPKGFEDTAQIRQDYPKLFRGGNVSPFSANHKCHRTDSRGLISVACCCFQFYAVGQKRGDWNATATAKQARVGTQTLRIAAKVRFSSIM